MTHGCELRVGLGCMRATPEEVIAAALDEHVVWLDTARAYGDSERVVGRVARGRDVRVVTKGGMVHEGDVWRPDGRARTLRADCDASLEALGGVPIDAYLVHAPDPNVPWATTLRALARIADEKLAARVGVCNVNRKELDEALDIAPIAVVQIALGAASDAAIRGGVVRRCIDRGITIVAHSPFGGPKRAAKLARDAVLVAIAKRHGASPHEIMLAAILDVHPELVVIPGATRVDTARSCARAASVVLDEEDRTALDERFGFRRALSPKIAKRTGAEVVVLMGLQGSGKSTAVASYVERGYERLNRDARGGTLRALHAALAEKLAAGATRVVLDNTYTTRAMRHDVVTTAHAHGATVRGVWHDISLADAQVNVIERMLAAHGRLLEPREMERAKIPTALSPGALARTARDMEPPASDEGFDTLETLPFVRRPSTRTRQARFVALGTDDVDSATDLRVTFAWQPKTMPAPDASMFVYCPHEAGPPRCWCRPPLPGLLLAFAAAHDVDLSRSVVVSGSAAHERLAAAVSARFEKK